MKSILFAISLLFSVFIFAQNKSSQEIEKNRIIANVYAILIDGKNDFENFKGDFINEDNKDITIYSAKNQNDATKNFFATKIKQDKSLYNKFLFESDDKRGELFFQTTQQVFEKLVKTDRLTKKELKFTIEQIETIGTIYYNVDGISPVAYFWLNSISQELLYNIIICANKNISNWVQGYVTANKISVPKPINAIAKTTSKPVKNNSEQKPISDLETVSNFLDSMSIEKIKKETQPQFPTSHLQPNYVADQIDTSTLGNQDIVRSQNGYHDYLILGLEAMNLTWGYGNTKEINLEKAVALNNEAIRIFPNLSDAYIGRGQVYSRLGNTVAAQNDFDKAKQLAPFRSKYIDRAQAAIEGKVYVDPDRVNTSYEYKAPTVLYNSASTPPANNDIMLTCSKCSGSGKKANPNWGKSSNYYIVNGTGQTQERSDYQTHIECDVCSGTGKIKY